MYSAARTRQKDSSQRTLLFCILLEKLVIEGALPDAVRRTLYPIISPVNCRICSIFKFGPFWLSVGTEWYNKFRYKECYLYFQRF